MGQYTPGTFDAELQKISQAFSSPNRSILFDVLHAEPARFLPAMEVYADGTDWNPGSGEGKYIRDATNTTWVFIGGVGAGLPDPDTMTDAATAYTGAERFGVKQAGNWRRITLTNLSAWLVNTVSTWIQAGTGAVSRTLLSKLRERVSVKDFGAVLDGVANDAAAVALADAVTGTAVFPNGTYSSAALPAAYPNTTYTFDGPSFQSPYYFDATSADMWAKRAEIAQQAGAHAGVRWATRYIGMRPTGSGANGGGNADYALSLSNVKQDYASSVVQGEIDGMEIAIRQGAANSDCAAILGNVLHAGTGFSAQLEGTTSVYDVGTAAVTQQVNVQIGVTNNFGSTYQIGYLANKVAGDGGAAFLAQGTGLTANWDNLFQGVYNGLTVASITKLGAATFLSINASAVPTLNQNTTGSAATLTTPRAIYGNNFDGSAALTQVIASTFGGTGNGFAKFAGPAAAEKTFTLPNASATVLTDNAAVTVAQGGTGRQTSTTAYGLIAAGTTATGALQTLPAGATTEILVGGGAAALPAWTTATGSGAPVRATSPTLVTPLLGTPTSGNLANCTFPTLNQSTTGSAATLTTSRTIDGQAFNGSANITVIAPGTHAATTKATPVDADELPLVDSAASFVLKKLTWANLKAAITAALFPTWTAYTPTITAGSGTFTTVSSTGRYMQVGKMVYARIGINITTAGTAAGALNATLPAGPGVPAFEMVGAGREFAATGSMLQAICDVAGNVAIFTYANASIIASGRNMYLSLFYEVA